MSNETNETSHMQQFIQMWKQLATTQMGQVTAFTAELGKWNALHAAQSEHVAQEMQKLAKESFSYANDMAAEVRKAQMAAAKKALSVFGLAS